MITAPQLKINRIYEIILTIETNIPIYFSYDFFCKNKTTYVRRNYEIEAVDN